MGTLRLSCRTVLVAVLALAACSGRGALSAGGVTSVRGTTFTLRAVNGERLPTSFSPLAHMPADTNRRLDSGMMKFNRDGSVHGMWFGSADALQVGEELFGNYVQDGGRVLINTGRSAPDTGEVSGRTL